MHAREQLPREGSPLRVLLLSPVPDRDPPNGDVTYTRELLANPPPAVTYTSYSEALDAGDLVELRRRGSASPKRQIVAEQIINRWRQHGLLFREPFRFFSIRPDTFDLVHAHVFSVAFNGPRPPLVVSNAAPITHLYADAFHWEARRVAFAARADAVLSRVQGVTHSTVRPKPADRMICFTQTLADWYLEHQLVEADRVAVVPNFVPHADPRAVRSQGMPIMGLVAAEPRAKGVDTFLEAVRRLRGEGVAADFVIVGNADGADRLRECATELDVQWLPRLPREELLEDFLPSLTALAYPSRFDGLPFILLEAMARGVPAAVSDYFALPEVIGGHGCAGLVSPVGDAGALAENLRRMLDPALATALGERALKRHNDVYSPPAVRDALRREYDLAVGSGAS